MKLKKISSRIRETFALEDLSKIEKILLGASLGGLAFSIGSYTCGLEPKYVLASVVATGVTALYGTARYSVR